MATFSLPRELVDIVIDKARKDFPTLRNFALASKPHNARCRMHLFRYIGISTDYDDYAERHQQLRSIIHNDPQVLTHVRELTIRDIENNSYDDPIPWLLQDTSLHETLYSLGRPNLKRFTFEVAEYYWQSFPAKLKHALVGIFTTPTLQYLCLLGIYAIPRSCCAAFCAQVASLSLVRVTFTGDQDIDLPFIPPSYGASKLWFMGIEDVNAQSIDIMHSALFPSITMGNQGQLPSLTALYIGPTSEGAVSALWQVVQAGAQSIKHFHWVYTHGSLVPPLNTSPMSLNVLDNLFAIEYEVTSYPDDEPIPIDRNDFVGLLALLRSVKQNNAIQDLRIKVNYPNYTVASDSLQNYSGWGNLDSLMSSNQFEDLREFNVEINLVTCSTEDEVDGDINIDSTESMERMEMMKVHLEHNMEYLKDNEMLNIVFKLRGAVQE